MSHQATFDGLTQLYEAILKLEKQNRNGIWARWLKNAFAPLFKGKFDFVAGNPPWINWESLSSDYRMASGPLWVKHGLVAKAGGKQFELGKQKRDFATLFTYAAMDAYLPPNGKLGFLITQTAFKTKSGERFRRFQLGNRTPLRVVLAEDLVEIQPFEGASNRTGLIILQRGQRTEYPIPYFLWQRNGAGRFETDLSLAEVLPYVKRLQLAAQPVEPADATSPWLTASSGAILAAQKAQGRSAYQARAGSCTWLNGLYWVKVVEKRPDGLLTIENVGEIGKIRIATAQHPVEPDFVYPLLRGRDVERWHAVPSLNIVLPHTAETGWRAVEASVMKESAPHTYGYFKRFEKLLTKRSGYQQLREGQPFYICANTGPWLFEPHKVVWREQAADFTAAVIGPTYISDPTKPLIPDHKLMLVPASSADEAHYLCAAINSMVCRVVVKGYVIETQTSVHVLDHIAVPRFAPANRVHQRLAGLSRRAHELAARIAANPAEEEAKRELGHVEDEVDHVAAAELWGLTDAELDEIRKALELLK